jgi:hypothetical protein
MRPETCFSYKNSTFVGDDLPGNSCYFDDLTKASGGMFMSDTGRNRAQGWRHAKLDGHANEKEFGEALVADSEFITEIQQSILGKVPNGSAVVKVDGGNAPHNKTFYPGAGHVNLVDADENTIDMRGPAGIQNKNPRQDEFANGTRPLQAREGDTYH